MAISVLGYESRSVIIGTLFATGVIAALMLRRDMLTLYGGALALLLAGTLLLPDNAVFRDRSFFRRAPQSLKRTACASTGMAPPYMARSGSLTTPPRDRSRSIITTVTAPWPRS